MIISDQGYGEIPAGTVEHVPPNVRLDGSPSADRTTEKLKMANSPAPGNRAVERSRWCWNETPWNDLAGGESIMTQF
jgi:hypothetical protein